VTVRVACAQGGAQYLVFNRVLVRTPSPLAMCHARATAITAAAHGFSLPWFKLARFKTRCWRRGTSRVWTV
jgi:hypothetical protein